MQLLSADQEFATADGTLGIMTKTATGKPESLLIIGGEGGRLDMYSEQKFDLQKCSLGVEYGGCKVSLSTKNRDKLTCIQANCPKIVHVSCDTFTRGILKMKPEKYKCPTCADIDPETGRKRPKGPR